MLAYTIPFSGHCKCLMLNDDILQVLESKTFYFTTLWIFSRALRPPGWLPQWHCGVRVISSKKLVGFISAIPAAIHIYET